MIGHKFDNTTGPIARGGDTWHRLDKDKHHFSDLLIRDTAIFANSSTVRVCVTGGGGGQLGVAFQISFVFFLLPFWFTFLSRNK